MEDEFNQKTVFAADPISKAGDVRNAALEEAAKFFDLNDTNLFWGNRAAGAIRALKTATPSLPPQGEAQADDMEARKDAAYLERNQVVAALAKCFPSGLARTAIEGWSTDWHGCVYIDLPTGQASWHFHDSHAYLFAGLPEYAGAWDGHDTPEKYRRLAAIAPQVEAQVIIAEVHAWAVCAAIATPADMMQNIGRIVEITSPEYVAAIASQGQHPKKKWAGCEVCGEPMDGKNRRFCIGHNWKCAIAAPQGQQAKAVAPTNAELHGAYMVHEGHFEGLRTVYNLHRTAQALPVADTASTDAVNALKNVSSILHNAADKAEHSDLRDDCLTLLIALDKKIAALQQTQGSGAC